MDDITVNRVCTELPCNTSAGLGRGSGMSLTDIVHYVSVAHGNGRLVIGRSGCLCDPFSSLPSYLVGHFRCAFATQILCSGHDGSTRLPLIHMSTDMSKLS